MRICAGAAISRGDGRGVAQALLFGACGTDIRLRLGFGAGAESRRPLGLAVVGGLVFSQLLTLYITPVYYIYMDSFQSWLRSRKKRKALPESKFEREPVLAGKAGKG